MRFISRGGWLLAFGLVAAIVSTGCSSCHYSDIDYCDLCCGPPISSAGADVSDCQVGKMVILRGSVRLPPEDTQVCLDEKDSLTFEWEQVSGPEVEIVDVDQREAYFIPAVPGVYKFRFRVTYPTTQINMEAICSQWDTVTIECGPGACGPPTADAGEDQVIATRPGTPQTAVLDGSNSHPALQDGCDCGPLTFAWTQVGGANVVIADHDQVQASVELSSFDDYEFQLEVTDSCGTDGRANTDADTVSVALAEKEGCASILDVSAIDALTGEPLSGVHVRVEDSGGSTFSMDTDAQGVASFDSLADGTRRYITLVSGELVPAHPLVGGADRQRFETTTVVNHCASNITVPMRRTASGDAAEATGTVVAKVPTSVYEMLPHSWQCGGSCSSDADCDETYYCELDETTPCGPQSPDITASCTPRSLLPFYSLADNYVSGQVRFVMVFPVLPLGHPDPLPLETILARPNGEDSIWPGNLATDDTFLNGLAPSLGVDPWGIPCTLTSDCPSLDNYVCEQDYTGDYRCKDKNPLRNVRIDVPAGQARRLVAVMGILDFAMPEMLVDLMQMLFGIYVDVDPLETLFRNAGMHSLLVCQFEVDVAADMENDISSELSALTEDDCWRVDYQQKDTVMPMVPPLEPDAPVCATDADCGWPDSGRKCLTDPVNPGVKKCFIPMFRVEVVSNDYLTLSPPAGGFDPYAPKADDRVCSWVPISAPFEVMCETSTPGVYQSCDPPETRHLLVPDEYECSFLHGLAMVSLEFPPQHPEMPEGGRVVVGLGFNRTPGTSNPAPEFLVPDLGRNGLDGVTITASQLLYRNVYIAIDGDFGMLPGVLSAAGAARSNVSMLHLGNFLPFLGVDGIDDVGMDVKVTFVAEDPTVFPPTLIRTYLEALGLQQPGYGTHELAHTLGLSPDASHDLIGLVVERVNQVERNRQPVVDPLWRIYIPPDATSISIPAAVSPFNGREEIRVTPWASSFAVPFDYDLFPADLILRHRSAYSRDSYGGTYPVLLSPP